MSGKTGETRFEIEGMTCGGCANAVSRIVRRIDPQADIAVDLQGKSARVVTTAAPDEIAQALTKGGYPARPAA